MKAYTNKPSTSKLVTRFDQELKKILMEDLRSYRAKTQFLNLIRQQPAQQALTAA
jgi:hypothetical protein